MQRRNLLLLSLTVILSVILSGCFQGEQSLKEIDAPIDAEPVDNLEDATSDEGEMGEVSEEDAEEDVGEETVARELYLVDSNGMVASQTLELPTLDSKEVATQVLTYLVKGGPVTSILPNGFQAVLPEGTEVLGLNLEEDGTLIVDVSSEFENYDAKDELKILQSMTYTLTQFENINSIKLWINGHPQNEMPVNGAPIAEGYSRVNGINIVGTDTLDLLNSDAITMYYPAEHNKSRYYVPVTQHIETEEHNTFGAIVQALIKGPGFNTNVTHVFNSQTLLKNKPTLKSGVLELVFSKEILKDTDKAMISDEVMETLVRTLTEQQAVEAIQVKVENKNELVNENGEAYNEPVTKKTFMTTEKL